MKLFGPLHAFLWESMTSNNCKSYFIDGPTRILIDPGHSPGSISFYWPEHKTLFTGDLIFKEGVGRTDLPGGEGGQLKKSIKGLAKLDVEWILTGHGEIISGAEARESS